jgi:hypothetical protein
VVQGQHRQKVMENPSQQIIMVINPVIQKDQGRGRQTPETPSKKESKSFLQLNFLQIKSFRPLQKKKKESKNE